jgi:hypothetical protein
MGKLSDFTASRPSKSSSNVSIKAVPVKAKTKVRSYMSEPEILSESPTVIDIQSIQLEFERKILALEIENKKLKSLNSRLSKNEEKLLNAIRSEILSQAIDSPIISRNFIGSKYNINEKYLGDAIKCLITKGLISRSPAKTDKNQSTFSWKLLK